MQALQPNQHAITGLHKTCLLTGLSWLLLVGCATQTVKSTSVTPMVEEKGIVAEEELLDVAIGIMDAGLDDIPNNREELTFADIRLAETQFVSWQVSKTLQSNGSWGIVRVNPNELENTDVQVNGKIIQSDGETMVVDITVSDATGRQWYTKEYKEVVSRFSYDPRQRRGNDPFQGMYNRIANDMLAWRKKNLNNQQLVSIRTVARLKFAQGFAPQVYSQYLSTDRRGMTVVNRMPAANDPILARIDTIRERDYMFIDALQDYYANFILEMNAPYTEFRRLSYDEVMKYDKLKADARRNMILGAAAIIGGIAAVQSDNAAVRYGAYGGLFGGGFLIKDAFSTKDEAQMHVEALAELGDSMQAEIAPKTITLDERVITLTGTVNEQYTQWREVLADIYTEEVGDVAPTTRSSE
jgi:hypothetical protein